MRISQTFSSVEVAVSVGYVCFATSEWLHHVKLLLINQWLISGLLHTFIWWKDSSQSFKFENAGFISVITTVWSSWGTYQRHKCWPKCVFSFSFVNISFFFLNVVSVFFPSQAVVAASVGGSEGFSSHREDQRPQRLQEAAQDQNQRSGALHQVRLVSKYHICLVTVVDADNIYASTM